MRNSLILLFFLGFMGCARFQQAAAPVPASSPAPTQTQVTDTAPVSASPSANFECSDGTVASSLAACQANMAQARLPPSQPGDSNPARPAATTAAPTGASR
jgi:hypothetical protein